MADVGDAVRLVGVRTVSLCLRSSLLVVVAPLVANVVDIRCIVLFVADVVADVNGNVLLISLFVPIEFIVSPLIGVDAWAS